MASSTTSPSSPPGSEPLDLEAGLPTTTADVSALRALRDRRTPGLLERMNDLSAGRLFGSVPRRRTTHAGHEPFTL